MHAARSSAFLAVALAGSIGVNAQGPSAAGPHAAPDAAERARIIYTFDEPQLQPPHYTLTIDESGRGQFVAAAGVAPAGDTDDVYPAPLDREIQLDPVLLADLFSYARAHQYFAGNCRRRGRLAFTGNKTIAYAGPDGRGSCAFVWAADPALQQLSDRLNAVAFTLEIGRRLDVEMRYYPLSLDAELASLEDAIASQRANDLPNIRPELESIAANQSVMERVRRRALALLNRCETERSAIRRQ